MVIQIHATHRHKRTKDLKKFLFILALAISSCAVTPVRRDLELLDEEIERIPLYTEQFNARCDSLRTLLDSTCTDNEAARFELLRKLYDAYSPNNVDSAATYASRLAESAGNNVSRKAIASSCNAICKIKEADYDAALALLGPVPVDSISRQAMAYYYRAKTWVYSSIYKNDERQWEPALDYWRRDSTTADALIIRGNYLRSAGKHDEALEKYDMALAMADSYYYMATTNMFKSYVYKDMGDIDGRIHFLCLSAVADLHNCAKEYESLFILSRILNREGDHSHALKYIQLTVQDAVAANYGVRIAAAVQASKVYNDSYVATQKQKHLILTIFVIVLSILLFILFLLTTIISSSHRKLSVSRRALAERSLIQNRFLGEYMELSSRYIDEVDRTRSDLRKVLRKDGVEALSKILRAPSFADSEIKNYYANFDNTFLAVFPDFKEKVAEVVGDGIELNEKNGEGKMSVSLRILALIRLGITDQKRISNILHISPWTEYSYLYRMRKSSGLSPKDFIDTIQSLCKV